MVLAEYSGADIQSLRPHSNQGGFKTYGNKNGIRPHHAAGWMPVNNVQEIGSLFTPNIQGLKN
ncbi:hypothetical protein CROQUDRAFT_98684 [Cronartium quercuum f. sp. fusiforme G11]|uniref:Uncharacterized protein n=1 Tax=Cronartium quercuum f. sp. fusiforme G11 TaxID=708437 RepID=A0A9P6NC06_9BASI|nr:hypothetical protein CROQUDRAFT_98684 [Cronartium quercuum f. sp. fusiforme G11]